MELFLSNKNIEISTIAEVLIEYVGLANLIKVNKLTEETRKIYNIEDITILKLENTVIEKHWISILENISKKSNFHKVLFGKDDEEASQITQFINQFHELTIKLDFLNKHLETRTYTTNQHITICDLIAYVDVFPELVKLSEKDKIDKCNVTRFADFIQHLPGLSDCLSRRGLTFIVPCTNKWVNLNDPILLQNQDGGKKKNKKDDKHKAKEEHFKKQDESKTDIKIDINPKGENLPKAEKTIKENIKEEIKPKEEKKVEIKKEPKQQAKKKEEDTTPAISKLDLRVGKIVKIWPNEGSDKLYNEEVDIGNGEIRTIASGLKKRIPIEILKDTLVVVIVNLKGRKLCDYFSHGMVYYVINNQLLCASEEGETGLIEALRPPEGSQAGDLITIGNFPRTPVAELNPKKNPWDEVKESLKVNGSNVACFGDAEWTTPRGKIQTVSLKNVKIS